jgi:hypothetical protein
MQLPRQKTVEVTVKGGNLIVTYDGTLNLIESSSGGGFTGTFLVKDLQLKSSGDGKYDGTGSVQVNGRVLSGSRSAPVNTSNPLTVNGEVDETDSTLVRLKLIAPPNISLSVPLTCKGVTTYVLIFSVVSIWSGPVASSVEVHIDGSTTVPAFAGASGSIVVSVRRSE